MDVLTVAMTGAGGALIAFFGWLVRKCWPAVRKFTHFIDDVAGEPDRPGVPGRPGLMERVAYIEHEVKTNHGSSLKDAVKRVETQMAHNSDQMNEQGDQLTELHEKYTQRYSMSLPTGAVPVIHEQ